MRLMAALLLAGAARALSGKGGGGGVRLDRLLNDRGAAPSRAACAELIRRGRVRVDGAPVKRLGAKVAADAAVTVDGAPLGAPARLWAYHKPVGVHSTARDDRGRPDLAAVLPRRAHPVGRLDADTSGLLLFSADGPLTHRLLSPRVGVEKEYVAECDVSEGADASRLAETLAGGVATALGTHVADVLNVDARPDGRVAVRLVVTEGKHRMVRRMLANCGFPVAALRRDRVGAVVLGDLAAGRVAPVAEPAALAWVDGLRRGSRSKPGR